MLTNLEDPLNDEEMTIQADEGESPDEDSMTEIHEDDPEIDVEIKGKRRRKHSLIRRCLNN